MTYNIHLFKITDENGTTRAHDGTVYQWGLSITNEAASSTARGEWAEEGIFAYDDELIAVFLAPLSFVKPKLWGAHGVVISQNKHFGILCRELTTRSELPLQAITLDQRVHFAILCALSVYNSERFVAWTQAWLKGTDRSAKAARLTAEAEIADAPRDVLRGGGPWIMPWLNTALSACAAAQALHEDPERVVIKSWHAALYAKAAESSFNFADLAQRALDQRIN